MHIAKLACRQIIVPTLALEIQWLHLPWRCSDYICPRNIWDCPFPHILAKLDIFILNHYQPERQKIVSHFNLHFLIRVLRILIFYLEQKSIGQEKQNLIFIKIRKAENDRVSTQDIFWNKLELYFSCSWF